MWRIRPERNTAPLRCGCAASMMDCFSTIAPTALENSIATTGWAGFRLFRATPIGGKPGPSSRVSDAVRSQSIAGTNRERGLEQQRSLDRVFHRVTWTCYLPRDDHPLNHSSKCPEAFPVASGNASRNLHLRCHWTVSDSIVVCVNDPEVAVIVTIEVPIGAIANKVLRTTKSSVLGRLLIRLSLTKRLRWLSQGRGLTILWNVRGLTRALRTCG
jgi:hypothetical protein